MSLIGYHIRAKFETPCVSKKLYTPKRVRIKVYVYSNTKRINHRTNCNIPYIWIFSSYTSRGSDQARHAGKKWRGEIHVQPYTSQRQRRQLPPWPLVFALVPLNIERNAPVKINCFLIYRVPSTINRVKEKMTWCPCYFKNEAYSPARLRLLSRGNINNVPTEYMYTCTCTVPWSCPPYIIGNSPRYMYELCISLVLNWLTFQCVVP